MIIMWIDQNGNLYSGDCMLGDREATTEELSAWELIRANFEIEAQREAIKAPFTDTVQIMAIAGDPEAMAIATLVADQLKALDAP